MHLFSVTVCSEFVVDVLLVVLYILKVSTYRRAVVLDRWYLPASAPVSSPVYTVTNLLHVSGHDYYHNVVAQYNT